MVKVVGYIIYKGKDVHKTVDVEPEGYASARITGVDVMAEAARLACDNLDVKITVEIVAE